MTTHVSDILSPETITQLQELIQINIDSRDGYRNASETIDDLTLQSAFEQLARVRDSQAEELATLVAWTGSAPRTEGSFGAVVFRAWTNILAMMSTDNRYTVLCEAERSEDATKSAYEHVIDLIRGSAADEILIRHYAAVKEGHDRIRDLRDEFKP